MHLSLPLLLSALALVYGAPGLDQVAFGALGLDQVAFGAPALVYGAAALAALFVVLPVAEGDIL